MDFAAGAVGSVADDGFAVFSVIEEHESLPGTGVLDVFDGGGRVGNFCQDEFFGWFFGEDAEGEEHDNGASENEGGAPDEVGPGAGFEAADKDIDGGKDGDEPAHGGEAIEDGYGVVVFGDEFGSGKDDGRCGNEDECDDGGDGHGEAGDAVESVLEEFGDGVESGFEEAGEEEEGDEDKGDGSHPLVGGNGHAEPVGGGAGHADKLLGGDVGGDEGEANEPR